MNYSTAYVEERTVATRGSEIHTYFYEGNGPQVLLIHGIGSSAADFTNVIPQMCAFSSPIAIDLRGHGASAHPAEGYHYSDYVSDLEDVISALSLHSPIVLGHSLGGIIALFWATQHKNAAAAIIIEDSPLRSGEDFEAAFDGWLELNSLPVESVREWYASKNPEWSAAVLDQRAYDMVNVERAAILELREISLAGEGLDTAADLGKIDVPLLLLHGDPDCGSMIHPEDLASFAATLPHTNLVRIPGAGHNIHRSHVDAWLSNVEQFIGNHRKKM